MITLFLFVIMRPRDPLYFCKNLIIKLKNEGLIDGHYEVFGSTALGASDPGDIDVLVKSKREPDHTFLETCKEFTIRFPNFLDFLNERSRPSTWGDKRVTEKIDWADRCSFMLVRITEGVTKFKIAYSLDGRNKNFLDMIVADFKPSKTSLRSGINITDTDEEVKRQVTPPGNWKYEKGSVSEIIWKSVTCDGIERAQESFERKKDKRLSLIKSFLNIGCGS